MRSKNLKNVLQLSRKKDAPNAGRSAQAGFPDDMPETAAERKRREQVLKGVEDEDEISPVASSSSSRGRGRSADLDGDDGYEESAAEKRRREAALGLGGGDSARGDDDSDDDDTPRVPPPVAKPNRGIRFAQSPVRQGKK